MVLAATPDSLDPQPRPGAHSTGEPPRGIPNQPLTQASAVPQTSRVAGTDIDIRRLVTSIQYSDRKLKPFRKRHKEAVRLFAGQRYGDGQNLDKTPLNLLRLAVEIWTRQLVSTTPQALILTNGLNAKVDAYELELGLNHLLKSIDLGHTMANVVRSAIFSVGVMKVGLSAPYLRKQSGFGSSASHPYAEQVLFEDLILDMNARTWDELTYIGNAYRVPLKSVMENQAFDAKARQMVFQRDKSDQVPAEEQASAVSGTTNIFNPDVEYRRMTELVDVYLPDEKVLVTLGGRTAQRALQVKPMELPEHGPYRVLSFSSVPGNLMPTAPAQHLAEMQILINRLFNQLARQASRAKNVTVADGKAVADGSAQRVSDAQDGNVIRVSHPDSIKVLTYDGADTNNVKLVGWLKELFSYLGGNLDTMGGLAAGTRTIGQEQLLAQSSSEMLRDMQTRVVKFLKGGMEDLGEILYTDPTLRLQLQKTISGVGEVPFNWTPQKRQSNFFSYNFDVVPFSEQNQSPQQRLDTLNKIVQQLLIPMSQQMAEGGQHLDVGKLVELLSRYSNLPELLDVVVTEAVRPSDQVMQAPTARRPLQSPQTTRNYVTENARGTKSTAEEAIMNAPGGGPAGPGGGGPS